MKPRLLSVLDPPAAGIGICGGDSGTGMRDMDVSSIVVVVVVVVES